MIVTDDYSYEVVWKKRILRREVTKSKLRHGERITMTYSFKLFGWEIWFSK